jgi:hypothetical protein
MQPADAIGDIRLVNLLHLIAVRLSFEKQVDEIAVLRRGSLRGAIDGASTVDNFLNF